MRHGLPDANKDTRDLLDLADSTVARMGQIIEDVLSYTRIIGEPHEKVTVDLNAVLQDVLAGLRADVRAVDAEIQLENLPSVLASPLQMHIYFQNLLSNAIKFRRPSAQPVVRVSCSLSEDGTVDVTVSDNGIGIPEHKHDQVFRIFKRLHADPGAKGNGVGLAVCQRVAANHLSSIRLASKPGEGAAFTITLPVSERLQP